MTLIANARMYAATPAAAAAWKCLFHWSAGRSGVGLAVVEHAFPAPLADLWARPDLGVAFMCGRPFVRSARRPKPLAAPVPAGGRLRANRGLGSRGAGRGLRPSSLISNGGDDDRG
jgi:hypothetical protein